MTNGLLKSPAVFNEPVKTYAPGTAEREALLAELATQAARVEKIPLVINGEHIFDRAVSQVVSPHRHSHILAEGALATKADVSNAIKASVAAQKTWSRMRWEDRAAVFLKAADLLSGKYRAVMNAATMLGQSKTCFQAEIDAACELADFWRFNVEFMTDLYRSQPISPAGMWNRVEYRGLEGFVYAITPFNFTSIALNLCSAPALMGCGVVWKPAHTSLLSSWIGMKILEEAGLPKGVINMVAGDPVMITEEVLQSPDLAGIHFTGSTQVFNLLWRRVGEQVSHYRSYPRLVGETGGKDFVFAHASADPDQVVTALIRGAFEFQGQKCSAASRAYIPESLWRVMQEKLVRETESIKMGDPGDFDNFMGAVIDERSFNKLTSYIEKAKSSNDAKVIAGGTADKKVGFFVRPTIIQTSNPHYPTMCEELFGPVLTVYVYPDQKFEETLAIAESTSPYALTGAIFAKDRTVLRQMTDALENAAGNFYLNDKPTGAVVGQQPFGGSRASGTNDKAGSALNLLRWTSMRTIKETFAAPTSYHYPHMT